LTKLVEQFILRAIHPMAVHRGWLSRGNLPELLESTEVIEANVVAGLGGPAQAIYPPVVTSRLHYAPIVERTPPALAGGAESIGRNAGDCLGLKIVFSQAEKIPVRPHIGAVVVHKDRDIPHHPDRVLSAIKAQRMPLFEKEK